MPFDADDPASYSFDLAELLRLSGSVPYRHVVLPQRRPAAVGSAPDSVDGSGGGGPQALVRRRRPPGVTRRGTSVRRVLAGQRCGGDRHARFDFSAATQFGSRRRRHRAATGRLASGRLTGIDIDETGVVFARFTNGQALSLGQIAVANFANPQGLQQIGNNAWVETFAAGEPLFGAAGQGDLGSIQSGGLEGFQRRHRRPTGQPDHGAAQLPGQRAGDQHRGRGHPDHHQHPLMPPTVEHHGSLRLCGNDRRARGAARAGGDEPQPGQRNDDRLSAPAGGRQPRRSRAVRVTLRRGRTRSPSQQGRGFPPGR
jgi:hypothetical protein